MKAAILNGLYAGTTTIDHIQPTCPGGNCTYPDYRSLAICTRSADVSSHLKSEKAYEESSPDNPLDKFNELKWCLSDSSCLIDDGSYLFTLGSAAKNRTKYDTSPDFSQSIAFKDSSAPIANVFMIYSTTRTPSRQSKDFAALEFLLEWCVQSYTPIVTNRTATTERHDAISDFSDTGILDDFTVASETLDLYQKYFRTLFQGWAARFEGNPQLYVKNDVTQVLFQPVNIFGEKINGTDATSNQGGGMDQLQKILDNIAVVMTNV